MNSRQDQHSHLFLVRFWSEEVGKDGDHDSWRGRVQHVISGEAHTFRDWHMLIDLLLEMAETDGMGGIENRVAEDGSKGMPQ